MDGVIWEDMMWWLWAPHPEVHLRYPPHAVPVRFRVRPGHRIVRTHLESVYRKWDGVVCRHCLHFAMMHNAHPHGGMAWVW